MAILNATAADQTFDASDPGTVAYQSTLVSEPNTFVWTTPDGHRIQAKGQNFTYSAAGVPTGGQVSGILIDLGSDGNFTTLDDIDVRIANVNASLPDIVSDNPTGSARRFWEAVLGDSDSLRAPVSVDGVLTGDFFDVFANVIGPFPGGEAFGGDDVISGSSESAATGFGGDLPGRLVGDAFRVSGMSLPVPGAPALLGEIIAGNDTITANGFARSNIVGDVEVVGSLGTAAGGDDLLRNRQHGEIFGAVGDDSLDGDELDVLSFASVAAAVVVNLQTEIATGQGQDTIDGRSVIGSSLNDRIVGQIIGNGLHGGNGDDSIGGGGGADTMTGGGGNDRLAGSVGRDVLRGGGGADLLTGGAGIDAFVFGAVGDSRPMLRDTITDFSSDAGDVIGLSEIDANTVALGKQAFTFGAGGFTGTPGQLRFTNSVLLGDTDGDRDADLAIVLTGVASLQPDDLALIPT